MISPGLRIGRYEVGKRLGRGGFGVVHVARDVDLDRDIAVKVLKPEYLTRPEIVQRFLNEARAAAKIGHAGIVTVFECGYIQGTGTRADGKAYIAMELLVGESLADRLLNGGRMGVAQAVAVTRQLADALAAAHAAGIVHRDLKPDNVFLVPDPAVHGGERVKVLDFGVAKLMDPGEDGVNTHSQMMLGTPKYMSPEQARSAAKVDHRSDIYTLGCMLFEMLTGRGPFTGDSGEQLIAHQKSAPPSVRAIVPEVPAALDTLIRRLLAKDPADRPQSMAAVVDALAETTGEPDTVTRTPLAARRASAEITTVQDASRPRIDRRLIAAAVIGAFVLATIIAIVALRDDERPAAAKLVSSEPPSVEARMPPEVAIDAGVVIDSPPPTVDTEADTLRLRCRELADKRRWAELKLCGEALRRHDAREAARIDKLALAEQRAEVSYRKLDDAIRRDDLVEADAALAAIGDDSVYSKDATARYDAAARAAIAGLVRLARDDCKAYEKLLARAKLPRDIIDEVSRATRCAERASTPTATRPEPRPTDAVAQSACDADALVRMGEVAFANSADLAALTHFEAALRCRPDTRVLQLAVASACKTLQLGKARLYYKRLTPAMRNAVLSTCINKGITVDMLTR